MFTLPPPRVGPATSSNMLLNQRREFFDRARTWARETMRSPETHALLWLCLPALLLGAGLRAWLTVAMPYGYIQYDTADFLVTAHKLLANHQLIIHGKKSCLTPILFAIPFLLHLPALILIPLAQHVMGIAQVLIAGVLVRLWFYRWRWFIVPATVLVAASPWSLWYEHTLMGEAHYLFFMFATALAGTLWARHRGGFSFTLFLLCLFLTASTRGEAKLIFVFGMLLVPLVLWGQWKKAAIHFALVLLIAMAGIKANSTSHAPSLLYATLIQLTPDKPKCDPDVAPYLIPLRDEVRSTSGGIPSDLVKTAKLANRAVKPYMREKYHTISKRKKELGRLFQRLSLEILLTRPLDVVMIPVTKFHLAVDGWSSGIFDAHELREEQIHAARRTKWKELSDRLCGSHWENEEAMSEFIAAKYKPENVAWLGQYQHAWNRAMIAFRLPDQPLSAPRWVHDYIPGVAEGLKILPGVPWFYLLAFAGMLAAAIRPSEFRVVQIAWVTALLGIWYAATMVGVTNPRFRFAYEPFCVIYLMLLFDCVASVRSRRKIECTTS